MTPNDTIAGLQATIHALACLERSMSHLVAERGKYHPNWYRAMAEPTVEEIVKLRAVIDRSIGLTEVAESARLLVPETDAPSPADGVHAPDPAVQPA